MVVLIRVVVVVGVVVVVVVVVVAAVVVDVVVVVGANKLQRQNILLPGIGTWQVTVALNWTVLWNQISFHILDNYNKVWINYIPSNTKHFY